MTKKEEVPSPLEVLGWWTCFIPAAAVMWTTIGYTLSMLWLWFAVPLGVMPVNGVHAIGLYLLINAMSGRLTSINGRDNDDGKMIMNCIAKTLFYLIILAVAYFLKGAA